MIGTVLALAAPRLALPALCPPRRPSTWRELTGTLVRCDTSLAPEWEAAKLSKRLLPDPSRPCPLVRCVDVKARACRIQECRRYPPSGESTRPRKHPTRNCVVSN